MQIALGSSDSLFFSSSIPFLQISPDPEVSQYTITVTSDNIQNSKFNIFSTSLYITGFFQFDIRSIIAAHMEARRLAFASYTITLSADPEFNIQNSTLKIDVIFSRGTFPGSASEFTQAYFLTSAQSRPLPPYNAFDSLSLYSESEGVADVEIMYTTDTGTFTTIKQFAYSAGLSRIDIDFEQIISEFTADNIQNSTFRITAATVTAGSRVMRYWFMRMRQSAAISFLNTFNCPEHFWIFGSWKRTGKISQQSAFCASEACAHTLDIDPEFEITTHPVGFRQAYIIPEISMSPIVWAYLFTDGSSLAKAAFKAIPVSDGQNSKSNIQNSSLAASTFKAVPTEGSLEASPQDKNFTEFTFKVIAAEKQYALGFNFDIPRIFTRQFSPEFT